MNVQRTFFAFACIAFAAACGDKTADNGPGDSAAVAPAGAPAPITPPIAPTDTTMAGHAMGDSMTHDTMMKHDSTPADTAKK
jgi:hypothetical protein